MGKLSSGQRQTLVRETIRRLGEMKRLRSDTDEQRDSTGPTFASGSLLVYKDPEQEEHFMRFIHITPSGSVLILLSVSTMTLFITVFFLEAPLNSLLLLPILVILNVVEVYIHVATRRLEDGNKLHRLLKTERILAILFVLFGTLSNVSNSYSVMANCSESEWTPIGSQAKAYSEGYCRMFSALYVIVYGFLAALRIIRFSVIVGVSCTAMIFTLFLWVVPAYRPERDTTVTVMISAIMVLASCGFLCFIRYVDEKQQRRHFETQERLIHSAEVLSEKRVATLERFLAVLPQTVSNRLRDGRWKRSQIDVASDATVLVTKIHKFEAWSTSLVPLRVAAIIALTQNEVDGVLRRGKLERVGRLGDTTVAVGNLLARSEGNMPAATVEVGKRLVTLQEDLSDEMPALVAAVHMGEVEGVLQGTQYVRYEVRGPAVDATRSAVLLCADEGRLLASTTAIDAVALEPEEWYKDGVTQDVPLGDDAVTFHRVDEQKDMSSLQISGSSDPTTAAMVLTGDDGMFVTGVSKLLGGNRSWIADNKENSLSALQQSRTTTSSRHDQGSSDSVKETPLEITTDRLGFYRFVDEAEQRQFREQQVKDVPQQAAKIWLGYAGFVALTLLALLLDFLGPYAAIGALALVLAVLCSVALALVPKLLSEERMASVQVPWTVIGMFVPLLTVFGAALSRPSMVGLDVRGYVALGAFMRSYCFNDARQQAVGVPLFSLLGTLHYLVPGAHDNTDFIAFVAVLILATVLASRNREGAEMRNHRRGVIAEALVHQIEEVTRVQRGLLRSSLPRCVFDAAVTVNFRGPRQVHQAVAVVMNIRAASALRNGSSSSSLSVVMGSGLEVVLDRVLSTVHLSTAGVLGDDAVVVGPVPTSDATPDATPDDIKKEEQALQEALELGLSITHGHDSPALSVLLDQDTVAHVVELGSHPNYSLLGVSATRLISISAHVAGNIRGVLVSDRVTAMVKTADLLQNVEVETQAPMMIRGQGVLRWNKMRKA